MSIFKTIRCYQKHRSVKDFFKIFFKASVIIYFGEEGLSNYHYCSVLEEDGNIRMRSILTWRKFIFLIMNPLKWLQPIHFLIHLILGGVEQLLLIGLEQPQGVLKANSWRVWARLFLLPFKEVCNLLLIISAPYNQIYRPFENLLRRLWSEGIFPSYFLHRRFSNALSENEIISLESSGKLSAILIGVSVLVLAAYITLSVLTGGFFAVGVPLLVEAFSFLGGFAMMAAQGVSILIMITAMIDVVQTIFNKAIPFSRDVYAGLQGSFYDEGEELTHYLTREACDGWGCHLKDAKGNHLPQHPNYDSPLGKFSQSTIFSHSIFNTPLKILPVPKILEEDDDNDKVPQGLREADDDDFGNNSEDDNLTNQEIVNRAIHNKLIERAAANQR